MNSHRVLCLLLIPMSLFAQGTSEFAYHKGAVQKAKPAYVSPMKTSIFLNVGISDYKKPALGFSIVRTEKWGYYANFMIGVDQMHMKYDYRIDTDSRLLDGENAGLIPFYTGRRAMNRLSASAGLMAKMVIPLYLYAGAGYGYRTETRELLNKKWVQTAASPGHSGVVEAGLIGQVDNVTLMAGYMLFIGQQMHLYHEAKIGIGYIFNK